MQIIFIIVFWCAVIWGVMATFSFDDEDVYTSYPVKIQENDIPLPLNISKYRVSKDGVVFSSMPGIPSGIDTYKNCTVFDAKNWDCRYEDGSGEFGVKNGDYWSIPKDLEYVSRFEYIILDCRWWAKSGWLDGVLGCIAAPFRR